MSEKIRIFFIGFIVGFAFTVVPVPNFGFFGDVVDIVLPLCRAVGFMTMIILAVPILIETFSSLKKSN